MKNRFENDFHYIDPFSHKEATNPDPRIMSFIAPIKTSVSNGFNKTLSAPQLRK